MKTVNAMKTPSTYHLMILAVVISSGAIAQSREEVPLFTSRTNGKVFEYAVDAARAEKQPKWSPSKTPPPLSIADAVGRADAWIKKRNPRIDTFVPRRIELSSILYGEFTGVWYYRISFDGMIDGHRLSATDFNSVVLLDGSVVEPRPGKW